MKVLISNEIDAAVNAALEERLFRAEHVTEPSLFMYLNNHAVVLGRNQNAWAECDVWECRRRGISIVRRLSGGGAVYHDLGNLNYSFVLPRRYYNQARYVGLIVSMLKGLGVPDVHVDQHYSILCGEKKIAGTAFALSGKTALIHGCILVSTDLMALSKALAVPAGRKVEGGYVGSHRMPVCRLADINSSLTVQEVRSSLLALMKRRYTVSSVTQLNRSDAAESISTYVDDTWTYGHGGSFTLSERVSGGLLRLQVNSGMVCGAVKIDLTGSETVMPQYLGRRLSELSLQP